MKSYQVKTHLSVKFAIASRPKYAGVWVRPTQQPQSNEEYCRTYMTGPKRRTSDVLRDIPIFALPAFQKEGYNIEPHEERLLN